MDPAEQKDPEGQMLPVILSDGLEFAAPLAQ
jgi:hypothetical protein